MRTYYVTYADEAFNRQAKISCWLARRFGNFDGVIHKTPTSIDTDFKIQNQNILNLNRGGGYWLWKPYIIARLLAEIRHGDVILYVDAGAHLIRSPRRFLQFFIDSRQDVGAFELPLIERQWTKSICFNRIVPDRNEDMNTNQLQASFIIIKKTEKSVNFINEYLQYCKDPMLLLDDTEDQPITSNFIAHRHDQSIFSLLYKKYRFIPFEDISHRGINPATYALSTFPGRHADDVLRVNGKTEFRFTKNKLRFKWRVPYFLFARKQRFSVALMLFCFRWVGAKLRIYKGLVC